LRDKGRAIPLNRLPQDLPPSFYPRPMGPTFLCKSAFPLSSPGSLHRLSSVGAATITAAKCPLSFSILDKFNPAKRSTIPAQHHTLAALIPGLLVSRLRQEEERL